MSVIKEQQLCTVDGCSKPSLRKSAALCAMHYHRQYRHGSTDKTAHGLHRHVRKYRRVKRLGHPLANKQGIVYKHRLALYTKIGPGTHQCFHCDTSLVWHTPEPRPNDPRLIYVDHLDRDTGNNAPDNIVPCCWHCNTVRGHQARHKALAARGWWSKNDTLARTTSGRKTC